MAKIALVCPRDRGSQRREMLRNHMRRFLERLRPDNLPDAPVMVNEDDSGIVLGVFNPTEPGAVHDGNAYAGWLAERREDWWQPGSAAPDGTYAMFRSDARQVELLADFCGSRTIWYAQTPDIFVASTSQRAIPWFTGAFEPNPSAMLWMLSSGSIGPGQSWDKRIRPLAPAGVARLNRETWRLDVQEPAIEFHADPVSDAVHRHRLRAAMQDTFAKVDFDWNRWVLPLSGGFDSRTILLWLRSREGLRTITWGTPQAPTIRGSDAWIAPQVARAVGVAHQYFELEAADESPKRVLDRFLLAGEARVDHLSGYLDGFKLWRELACAGVGGIVRGDHCFGHRTIGNADGARLRTGLILWSDHVNLPSLREFDLTHLGEQRIPEALVRQPDEAAADWRDRLYQAFRIPSIFGALSELKSPYVEVANPLLLRRFAELARAHPAQLRTDKKLARDVAAERSIPVAYADSNAIVAAGDMLASVEMKRLLLEEFESSQAGIVFPDAFRIFLARQLEATTAGVSSRRRTRLLRNLKRLLPTSIRSALSHHPTAAALPIRRLALRAAMITRMTARLTQDARESCELTGDTQLPIVAENFRTARDRPNY